MLERPSFLFTIMGRTVESQAHNHLDGMNQYWFGIEMIGFVSLITHMKSQILKGKEVKDTIEISGFLVQSLIS